MCWAENTRGFWGQFEEPGADEPDALGQFAKLTEQEIYLEKKLKNSSPEKRGKINFHLKRVEEKIKNFPRG